MFKLGILKIMEMQKDSPLQLRVRTKFIWFFKLLVTYT